MAVLVTRREGVIGLVVVTLCVAGFFTFAGADLRQQRALDHRGSIEDRRAEVSMPYRRVRVVRFLHSDLRIRETGRLEPDHFVPADRP